MAFIRGAASARCSTRCAPLRGGQAAARPDDDLHEQHRAAGARRAARLGAESASRTTRRRPGCTPRRGCSTAASGYSTAYIGSSNLTHSARSPASSGTSASRRPGTPTSSPRSPPSSTSYWDERRLRPLRRRASSTRRTRAGARPRAARLLSPIELELRPIPGTAARADRARPPAGPPPQPARRRDRHRQDRHGRRRLRAGSEQQLHRARAAVRRPPRGDPRPEPARPSATRCATPLRRAVGRRRSDRRGSSTSSRRSRASTPPTSRTSTRTHFDVVIVDEFHHAAAPSYQRAARPPRARSSCSGSPRRPSAATASTSSAGSTTGSPPSCGSGTRSTSSTSRRSSYFGIHDGLDLREVPWRRGRGYDVDALDQRATPAERRLGALVVEQVAASVADPSTMRASASASASSTRGSWPQRFNDAGHRGVAVWGDSPRAEREAALRDLAAGACAVVFSVDLFNEGVDVPAVDTLLLLRPTESPTLFLQQLGRGLRQVAGQGASAPCSTSSARTARSSASTAATARCSAARAATSSGRSSSGFPFLPAGCNIELDRSRARSCCAASATRSRARWRERSTSCARSATSRSATYLEETGLDLEDVYAGGHSWSEMRRAAGLPLRLPGPRERRCSAPSAAAPRRRRRADRGLPAASRAATAARPCELSARASGGCSACSSRR